LSLSPHPSPRWRTSLALKASNVQRFTAVLCFLSTPDFGRFLAWPAGVTPKTSLTRSRERRVHTHNEFGNTDSKGRVLENGCSLSAGAEDLKHFSPPGSIRLAPLPPSAEDRPSPNLQDFCPPNERASERKMPSADCGQFTLHRLFSHAFSRVSQGDTDMARISASRLIRVKRVAALQAVFAQPKASESVSSFLRVIQDASRQPRMVRRTICHFRRHFSMCV
jgi:hypothetical protein